MRQWQTAMLERVVNWIANHVVLTVVVLWGVFVWVPFLAPVLMRLGWTEAAQRIYMLYSVTCHQLPQRSFFLFGEQVTYELETIQQLYHDTNNQLVLRRFIGTPTMGWKVAWSDRMVSFYGGIWLWLVVWQLLPPTRRPRLRWYHFLLLGTPMVVDGVTHMISDLLYGIGSGFRDTNTWVTVLVGNLSTAKFYAGDGLGTLNSTLRLATGLLFSLGLVGWLFSVFQLGKSATETGGVQYETT